MYELVIAMGLQGSNELLKYCVIQISLFDYYNLPIMRIINFSYQKNGITNLLKFIAEFKMLTQTKIIILIFSIFLFKCELRAQKPSIKLKGNDTITIYRNPNNTACYSEIANETFTATDSLEGDLSLSVIQTSNLDCTKKGWYKIGLKVTNSLGKTDSAFRHILVRDPLGLPTPDFTISNLVTDLYYSFFLASVADSGAYQFEWKFTSPSGIVTNSSISNPVVTADEPGRWKFCMRAGNTFGWSAWRCMTGYCAIGVENIIGPNQSTYSDTGVLYDNGGPDGNYSNNRQRNIDQFTINHNALNLQLNIEKLKLSDTGDRLFIFTGTKALHPSGGFGPGDIVQFPKIFLCDSGIINIQFKSNGSGTDSGFVIRWKPNGQENVAGFVFYDMDTNCIYDPLKDYPSENFLLKINNRYIRNINSKGIFSVSGDTSVKYLKLEAPKNWIASCSTGGLDTWSIRNRGPFEFVLKPAAQKTCDFSTEAFNHLGPIVVRGLNSNLTIQSINSGNIKADKINCIIKSDRKLSYIRRLKNTYKSTDTSIEFTENISTPFHGKNAEKLEFMVKAGDTGTVKFTCSCYPERTDSDSSNNTHSVQMKIVNAHDPNDKMADIPDTVYTKPDRIVYRVRFQNTGTWPATNVIVTDTLSKLLDTQSLALVETSHSCQMERTGYAVAFKFFNIHLQDSNSNEPESHGFILYSIKPKMNLLQNQPIYNTAHIYFDAEKPVVTNTTSNKWILPVLGNTRLKPQAKFNIFPNPGNNLLTIKSAEAAPTRFTLTDMLGNIKLDGHFTGIEKTLNISNLTSGIYLLTLESPGSVESTKVLVLN